MVHLFSFYFDFANVCKRRSLELHAIAELIKTRIHHCAEGYDRIISVNEAYVDTYICKIRIKKNASLLFEKKNSFVFDSFFFNFANVTSELEIAHNYRAQCIGTKIDQVESVSSRIK